MLSIEEIKLLIEKLEKVKKEDLQELIDNNLKILKDIELAVDANNQEEIDRLDKTKEWFRMDVEQKRQQSNVEPWLYDTIRQKIQSFGKTEQYNSLEIGPGTGLFSKEFRAWTHNYFIDVLPELEDKIFRRFHPAALKNLKFYVTDKTNCAELPKQAVNFVFSWDTFVFFTQEHIAQYLEDLKTVLIPGGHCFIQYADCHFDFDLKQAKRGYWNYNTKTAMEKIIKDAGYEALEWGQYKQGANYVIFQRDGKQNPVVFKKTEIVLD